jgi:hypothetical protein
MINHNSISKRLYTGWKIWVRGFDFRRGLGILLLSTASRPALRLTQPPIQCVSEDLSPRVDRPRHEDDRSPVSSAEVKNAWHYTSTPIVFMAWYLVKHRDKFTF